jgi:hypothetical protein
MRVRHGVLPMARGGFAGKNENFELMRCFAKRDSLRACFGEHPGHPLGENKMKRLMAIAVSFFFLVASFPVEQARAVQQVAQDPPQEPFIKCDGCAAGLSKAVVTGALQSVKSLHAKLRIGEARAVDVQTAVVNLRILFAHLDETGTTKAVEQHILAKQEEIIRYTPTRPDAEHIQKQHAALGLRTTADEHLQRLNESTVNDRMRAVQFIKQGGLRAYYARVLANYTAMGTRMAKAEKNGLTYVQEVHIYIDPNADNWGGSTTILGACDYKVIAAVSGIGCAFGCLGCCVVGAFAALFGELEC